MSGNKSEINIYIDLSASVTCRPEILERMLEAADRESASWSRHKLWGFDLSGVWPIRTTEDLNPCAGGGSLSVAVEHAQWRQPALIITDDPVNIKLVVA